MKCHFLGLAAEEDVEKSDATAGHVSQVNSSFPPSPLHNINGKQPGASSSLDLTLEDLQQDCQKCDNTVTPPSVTYMDHSGDYANINSPSSMLTADSDTSNQSAPDTSPLIPDMHHIPKQQLPIGTPQV